MKICVGFIIFILISCNNSDISETTTTEVNNIPNDIEEIYETNTQVKYDNYLGIYKFESIDLYNGIYKEYDEERVVEYPDFNDSWIFPRTKDMYIEIKLNNNILVAEMHTDFYSIPDKNIFKIELSNDPDGRILGLASQDEVDYYYYVEGKIIREYEVWEGEKYKMVFVKE
jgi:hypothetical protein